MPESSLWALIVALVMLALGFALKLAEYKSLLSDKTKRLDAAWSEIANIKQSHDQAIIGIKKEYQNKIDELTNHNSTSQADRERLPKSPHLSKPESDFDAAFARLLKLSKPIEPASASSAPGPDDYHAKRRSFFHSDNDRPKRR